MVNRRGGERKSDVYQRDAETRVKEVTIYLDTPRHGEWCRTHFVNERAGETMEQLKGVCDKIGLDSRASCGDEVEPMLKSLARGL